MRKSNSFNVIIILSVIFLFCLGSCKPKWDEAALLGSWEVHAWTEINSDQSITDKMDFTFDGGDDKRYLIDYGTMKEEGKYWIEYDYLVTVEDGGVAKKVKIISMASDTLEFNMNRAGALERLVLSRVK